MVRFRADYSGRPQYELILDVSVHSYSGDSVRWNWHLFAHSKQGWGSHSNDLRTWTVYIGSPGTSSGETRMNFGPSGNDYVGKTISFGSGTTGWVTLGASGHWMDGQHWNVPTFGGAMAGGTAAHRPLSPTPIGVDSATQSSLRYRFSSRGNGGSSIIRWEVQYSKNSNFSGGTIITSGGTSTVTGLDPDTTYYFRSRGINGEGTGAWSASSSAKTLAGTPGAPQNPSAEIAGGQIQVTWDPPTSDGGSPITGYEVQYADNAGFADPSDPELATSPKNFSLGLGTWYFRVRALNANGTGAWSSVVSDTVVRRGFPKFFDGDGWVVKPVKVYLDGEWVQKPIKAYTGSEWVTPE